MFAPRLCFTLCGAPIALSLLATLAIFMAGCASKAKPIGPGSIVRSDNSNIELDATVEDQARAEALNSPRLFFVSFEDDTYSWERARFFLENYVGAAAGHNSVVTKVVGDRLSLASNPGVQAYQYEVVKDSTDGGFNYSVFCAAGAGGDSQQADLNAGNLARFVRDGRLELSLLPKS